MLITSIILLIIIIWGISIYNLLISNKNQVNEGWSGIDVQLKMRHNLVPNLVAATKQYAKYEKAVLETVVELRTQSEATSDINQKSKVEDQLGDGLKKLVALVEQYPDLKANENFAKLQDELVDIEDQLQYARRYYNGAVRKNNIDIERFPNLFIARLFKFKLCDFFQLESSEMRKAPSV